MKRGRFKELKFFNFFKIVILILTAFVSFFAFSKPKDKLWPSLFVTEDFIPLNSLDLKKTSKLNRLDLQKMTEEDLQSKVMDSFYFIADFGSSIKENQPRNWFDSAKNPEKSLLVGFPPEIKRPQIKLHFPLYNLSKLVYFKADDPYTSRLNMCQEFWLQNRLQMAYDCFFFLQMDLANDKISVESVIRLNVNLVHGFFLIFLATNDEKNILIWNAKTIPPSTMEYTDGDHYSIARSLFSFISTRLDDAVYLPPKKEEIIIDIYKSAYDFPVYFKLLQKIVGRKATVTLLPEPVEPLKWIRTVMPIVYINSMAMNQGMLIWQRAFTSAQKLESYFKRFDYPPLKNDSPLVVGGYPTTTSDIYVAPKNNTDILAMSDLFRANAMIYGRDPTSAIEYISSGILRKGHPEITGLLFALSGEIYFDLDILRWARRSYSWAELYSKSLVKKSPSSVFFGAESAFWQGMYPEAKLAYERFLKELGDPNYGPWARLRLAEIAEIEGKSSTARTLYEHILKNFDRHPASQDAQVRLFCLYEKDLTPNAKKVEYNKVVEKITSARDSLRKQAKTCMLRADLKQLTKNSVHENKKNVVERAKLQKDAIESYTNEFPKSEFLTLFADRLRELELGEGTLLASQNKCNDLIEYYNKNRTELKNLEANNKHYVYGLKWDAKDKLKLLRCAVFVNNLTLWKEMRKDKEVGKDGGQMHQFYFELTTAPSTGNALKAYHMLKNDSNNWIQKIKKFEKSNFDFTEQSDFWELLTLQKLLKVELVSKKSTQELLNAAIIRDLLQKPDRVFQANVFCNWILRNKDTLNDSEWDILLEGKQPQQWLALILDENVVKASACEKGIAKSLFAVSLTRPSANRDKYILMPYLEKKGISRGAEEWLRYAQRLERERGLQDSEVIELYRKLVKEAKEPLIKSAARAWLQKNVQEEADKLLW